MIPDYFDTIQRQISFNMGEDLTINHLYDDQIDDPITQEIYNYIIYRYICLGYNDLYAILDFRPDPVLIITYTEDPRIKLQGYLDFISLTFFLKTPNQPTIRFHILISKQ